MIKRLFGWFRFQNEIVDTQMAINYSLYEIRKELKTIMTTQNELLEMIAAEIAVEDALLVLLDDVLMHVEELLADDLDGDALKAALIELKTKMDTGLEKAQEVDNKVNHVEPSE